MKPHYLILSAIVIICLLNIDQVTPKETEDGEEESEDKENE